MKLEKININELKPAEYNPRFMSEEDQQSLKKGITTFGLVDPIIIDLTDNNTVIGGHQRLEVLKEINSDMDLLLIPYGDVGLVIQQDEIKIKDKNDQKALNLALNRISGEFDNTKLDVVLSDLNNESYDLELTGFDDDEIMLATSDFDLNDLLDDYDLDEDEEEELPEDYKEIQGKTPEQNHIVILSFQDKEIANKYLKEKLGINKRISKTNAKLIYGQDFTL